MQRNHERHQRGNHNGHPAHGDGHQWASGRESYSERENDDRDETRFGGPRNSERCENCGHDRSARGGYTPADYRSFDNHGNYDRGNYGHHEDRRTFNPNENDRYGRSGPDRGIGGSYDDHHGYARENHGRDDHSVNVDGGYHRHGGYQDRGYPQQGYREQQRPQQSYGRGGYGRDEMRPFGRDFDGGFDRGDFDRHNGRRGR